MTPRLITTPEGTRDRLFAECSQRRALETALSGLFENKGYCEVITPEVEFYDLFIRSGNPLPQESMLKVVDRSGKILVMRPDCTAPIARLTATKLKNQPLPLRFFYRQTVFRSGTANQGIKSEIAQCGIELIGAAGLKGDLEVIAMAIEALECTGAQDYHLELGHAGFFKALTEGLDIEERELLHSYIENNNFAALGDYLGSVSEIKVLKKLSSLFGGIEVLDEAEGLSQGCAGALEAIEYLRSLYHGLGSYRDKISFDLGLVNQIDYYTGVVFRAYIRGAGSSVMAGGRYDDLMGHFGLDAPATGFAMDIDAVASCLTPMSSRKLKTIIHYEAGLLDRALERLDGDAELSPMDTVEESIALATEKGVSALLIIGNAGERTIEL